MNKEYYIFGLQRSGTNFLRTIIDTNFEVEYQNTHQINWKHNVIPPKEWDKNIPTIIIYKDIYMWIESIAFRNPADIIKTQKEYLLDILKFGDMSVGNDNLNLNNLVKLYNDFMENWSKENVFWIKYEHLLEENKLINILKELENTFDFKKNKTYLQIPDKGSIYQSPDYSFEREKYYILGEPHYLSQEQCDFIENNRKIYK